MKTQESDINVPEVFSEDDLLRLEIQVARRADELSLGDQIHQGRDLQNWLQAEHEVVQQHLDQLGRLVTAS